MTNMPLTKKGNRVALLAVNLFTGYIQICPMPDRRTETLIEAIRKTIIKPFGIPKFLRSDNEPGLWTSNKFFKFLQPLGTKFWIPMGQRTCRKKHPHHQRRRSKIPHTRKTDWPMGYVRLILHKCPQPVNICIRILPGRTHVCNPNPASIRPPTILAKFCLTLGIRGKDLPSHRENTRTSSATCESQERQKPDIQKSIPSIQDIRTGTNSGSSSITTGDRPEHVDETQIRCTSCRTSCTPGWASFAKNLRLSRSMRKWRSLLFQFRGYTLAHPSWSTCPP